MPIRSVRKMFEASRPSVMGAEAMHLLDHMLTGVILVDKDLNILKINSAVEVLLQLSERRLLGSSMLDLFTGSDLDLSAMCVRSKLHVQSFAQRNLRISIGQRSTLLDFTATPVDLSPVEFIFELHAKDRQSKILREEMIAKKHKLTRQLIRGVAHEIKNPLAGIRGAAQLLLRGAGTTEDVSEFAEVIITESDRLKSLADSMLGSNKPLRLELINIHEPIEHIHKLLKAQHHQIELIRDYDLSIPEIDIDKNRIIQVLLNICINAINAMVESDVPKPVLKLKTRIKHHVTAHGQVHRQMLCINIEDNGPGIPKKLCDTLFYPMVTGRAQGSGLGLSIAQDLIFLHGGYIEFNTRHASSKPKTTGTEFTIYLPTDVNQPLPQIETS